MTRQPIRVAADSHDPIHPSYDRQPHRKQSGIQMHIPSADAGEVQSLGMSHPPRDESHQGAAAARAIPTSTLSLRKTMCPPPLVSTSDCPGRDWVAARLVWQMRDWLGLVPASDQPPRYHFSARQGF